MSAATQPSVRTDVPSAVSAPHAGHMVVLLFAVASAGYICRTAITVVAPQMMAQFGLTLTQMGMLFSAFLAGYTIFQVPSGWLADRVSPYRIFLALAMGWAVLTFATASVNGRSATLVLFLLFLIRMLFGVMAAPTYPASARAIAGAVAPGAQARANGTVLASIGIGSAISPLLIAPLADHFSWRVALLATAAITAAAALAWWKFAPAAARVVVAPPRKPYDVEAAAMDMMVATERRNFRLANQIAERISEERRVNRVSPLKGRSFQILCASYFLQGYVGYIFVFWSFLYLREVRHFSLGGAAVFTALPMIASIFAIPLGGVVSDAAVKRLGPTWGRRSLPLVALLSAGILLLVGARSPSAMVAVSCLSICTVLVLATEGPYWATVNQLARSHGGIGGGIMNFGANLGGMISPTLTPWLAERLGWSAALAVAAGLSLIAGILWMGVWVRRPQPTVAA